MANKLLKIALVGKTNAGKSTLINSIVGENISIVNKKNNTTLEVILGIKNINNLQLIFYDTPGFNTDKSNNKLNKTINIIFWETLKVVDIILFIVDVTNYNYNNLIKNISKINESNKKIFLIFNKIDLIENSKVLSYIDELKNLKLIESFFNISAKKNKNIDLLYNLFLFKSYKSQWIYNNNEISNKDDIFISNECTRNAILECLHQEVPYNLKVLNINFKYLKNNDLKIKQLIKLKNSRYKPIILGKNGKTIKKIRERSQKQIQNILKCKVHLYLQVIIDNEK